MNELQKSAGVQVELSQFYMLVLYWMLCTFVMGGVPSVFLPAAGGSGIIVTSQGKEFPETPMGE